MAAAGAGAAGATGASGFTGEGLGAMALGVGATTSSTGASVVVDSTTEAVAASGCSLPSLVTSGAPGTGFSLMGTYSLWVVAMSPVKGPRQRLLRTAGADMGALVGVMTRANNHSRDKTGAWRLFSPVTALFWVQMRPQRNLGAIFLGFVSKATVQFRTPDRSSVRIHGKILSYG